jgi:hypothetical protein
MNTRPVSARGVGVCLGSMAGFAALAAAVFNLGTSPARAESSLSGQQLYALHCARCHVERYATERTDAQWQTILLHMRVHASLPGADAKKIADYLKASN